MCRPAQALTAHGPGTRSETPRGPDFPSRKTAGVDIISPSGIGLTHCVLSLVLQNRARAHLKFIPASCNLSAQSGSSCCTSSASRRTSRLSGVREPLRTDHRCTQRDHFVSAKDRRMNRSIWCLRLSRRAGQLRPRKGWIMCLIHCRERSISGSCVHDCREAGVSWIIQPFGSAPLHDRPKGNIVTL